MTWFKRSPRKRDQITSRKLPKRLSPMAQVAQEERKESAKRIEEQERVSIVRKKSNIERV